MRNFIVFVLFLFVIVSCGDSSVKQEADIDVDIFPDVDDDKEFVNEKECSDEDEFIDTDADTIVSINENENENDGFLHEDEFSDDDQEETEPDCVEVEISHLENIEENGRLFFQGNISEVNGAGSDIIKFAFLNEDGSWNYQLQEKSYDLGSVTNSNPYECTECLWVISEISDDETKKHYFQESGTFKVDTAGEGVEAKGTLSAKLVEVTVGENFIKVKNGTCIEIKNADIDTFCYPDCDGKICGNDGCGGICGNGCADDEYCNNDQSECIKYNCDEFEINSVKSFVDDWRYLYEGEISNINNEQKDLLKVSFFNEDRSWNDYFLEKQTYYLDSTDNSDPWTCMECFWVYSDIISNEPQKRYFQQSGKFEVEEVGRNVEAYGILNARFIEMELDENDKYMPIPEGHCIEVKNAEIDTLCEKKCDGKVCGDDGCGGICGNGCGADEYCSSNQSACIEYDCKNVTIDWGVVLLGQGPGSGYEYEMRIYMEFNEFFTYPQYDDFVSIELWKKFVPGIYDVKNASSMSILGSSFISQTGAIVSFFVEESGEIEIEKVDYTQGVFEAKLHKLRMIEASPYDMKPVIGGLCIEINDEIKATTSAPLKSGGVE